jgi:actin
MEGEETVIFDVGSFETKAGLAVDSPYVVSRSLIGRLKYASLMVGIAADTTFCGEEVLSKRGVLNVKNIMHLGHVEDYHDFETYLQYCYREMRLISEEHPVVATEPIYPSNSSRERLAQIYFETMNVPSYYVVNSSAAALMASGLTTGTVVSIGKDNAQIVPVLEGRVLPDAALFGNVGGEDLTDYLISLLSARGYEVTTSAEREIARQAKHTFGRAALSYDEISQEFPTVSYTLPTEEVWEVQKEAIQLVEPLFQPSLVGYSAYGIHDLIWQVHRRAPQEHLNALRGNILLCGGSSMFPGMQERLTKQLAWLFPSAAQFRVLAPPERKFSSWIGASILSTLEEYKKLYITKDQYEEHGPSLVHTKCL